MATDFSGRPQCDSCVHASVCPNRETFLKFYNHKNQIMVKCGNGSGELDTSSDLYSIRVEYRYLDGPALEQLYRELGLHGPSYFPCMSAFYGCPLGKWNHPFDSPIYAPYPRPVGYIPELCTGARNYQGYRVPFVAPLSPPRTNEVHAAPFNPTHWISCATCPNGTTTPVDYAKLGGTVYSTFATGTIDASEGQKIFLADIPDPSNLMGNYVRSDINAEFYTITGEDNVIYIYYAYRAAEGEAAKEYNTMAELEEQGMIHYVRIFHSIETIGIVPGNEKPGTFSVAVDGVFARIGRQSDDGSVKCPSNYFMPIAWTDEYGYPDINRSTAQLSNSEVMTNSDFRDFQLVAYDKIYFRIRLDKDWAVNLASMRYQLANGTMSLMQVGTFESFNDYMLLLNMGEADENIVIQIMKRSIMGDPINYPRIDYDAYLMEMPYLALHQVEAKNIGGEVESVKKRAMLRTHASKILADSSPDYTEDAPPANILVQEYLKLVNYTIASNARFTFASSLSQVPPSACVNAREINFRSTRLDLRHPENSYWALWQLDYEKVDKHVQEILADSAAITSISSVSDPTITIADTNLNGSTLTNKHNVMMGMVQYHYDSKALSNMLNAIEMALFDRHLQVAFYDIPMDAPGFALTNTYGANEETDEDEFLPFSTIVTGSGDDKQENPLSDYFVDRRELDNDGKTKHNILMIVQPENFMGMRSMDQNFCGYFIQCSEIPKEIEVVLKFDGKDMQFSSGQMDFNNIKGYELMGVIPEDINDVDITIDPDARTATLVGEKSIHYVLSSTYDVSYEQLITANMHVPDFDGNVTTQTSYFKTLYRGATDISFRNDDRYPIKSITINGSVIFDRITVEEGGVTHSNVPRYLTIASEEFSARSSANDTGDSCTICIYDIKVDLTIEVDYDPAMSKSVCERCKDYVDAEPYKFITWEPYCGDYQE